MTAARFTADLAAMGLSRRRLLAAGGAAGLAAPLLLRGRAALAQARPLVVVGYGQGDTTAAWTAAWAQPYTSDTGTRVSVIEGEPTPAAIKAQVDADRIYPNGDKVLWDCVEGDIFDCPLLGRAGLIQPYDYGRVDKAKVRPEFVTDWGCAAWLYSSVNGYDRDKLGGKVPDGYRDYLNFRDFPGRRAMYRYLVGSLEPVLLASGVDPARLYPLDVERAFAAIRANRDRFALWDSGGQAQELFRSGEVVMGPIWSTRAARMDRETKGRLTWTWDQGIVSAGVLQVPTRNPAGPAVFDFVASTQDAQRQVELVKALDVGTANPTAGEIEEEAQQKVDCGHEPNYRRQIPIDVAWYAENYARVQDRFLDLLGG